MGRKRSESNSTSERPRPNLSPDARIQRLISLSFDLVEQRLIDGTATSQETTHFLKLADPKHKIEVEILEKQKDLVVAKTESIASQQRQEELYAEAMKAFKTYSGQGDDDEYY